METLNIEQTDEVSRCRKRHARWSDQGYLKWSPVWTLLAVQLVVSWGAISNSYREIDSLVKISCKWSRRRRDGVSVPRFVWSRICDCILNLSVIPSLTHMRWVIAQWHLARLDRWRQIFGTYGILSGLVPFYKTSSPLKNMRVLSWLTITSKSIAHALSKWLAEEWSRAAFNAKVFVFT